VTVSEVADRSQSAHVADDAPKNLDRSVIGRIFLFLTFKAKTRVGDAIPLLLVMSS